MSSGWVTISTVMPALGITTWFRCRSSEEPQCCFNGPVAELEVLSEGSTDPGQLIARATEVTNGIPDLLCKIARLYRGGLRAQLSHQARLEYKTELSELQRRHTDLKRHNDFVVRCRFQLIEFHPQTYSPLLETIDGMWELLNLRSLRECVLQRGDVSPVPAMLFGMAGTFGRHVENQLRQLLKSND